MRRYLGKSQIIVMEYAGTVPRTTADVARQIAEVEDFIVVMRRG